MILPVFLLGLKRLPASLEQEFVRPRRWNVWYAKPRAGSAEHRILEVRDTLLQEYTSWIYGIVVTDITTRVL